MMEEKDGAYDLFEQAQTEFNNNDMVMTGVLMGKLNNLFCCTNSFVSKVSKFFKAYL